MATIDPSTEAQPPASPEYADPVDLVDHSVEEETYEEPKGPSATLPPIVDPEGEIEELEDRSAPVKRRLWAEHNGKLEEKEYTQEGLKFFGKIELYGLLGQAVKVVLEGDNPLSLDSIMGVATNPRQMVNDLMGYNANIPGADDAPDRVDAEQQMELEAGKILGAVAQVVSMAPEILSQAYCIALAIPKGHRPWAMNWALPNMDDETGTDILHTFIDQNWGVMEDFFAHELPKIIKRVVKARKSLSDGRR